MEQTAINDVTLYRIEKGHTRPQARTLDTLLDLYGATTEQRANLSELIASARAPGWLRPVRSILGEAGSAYVSFESTARSARNYETILIPGLLQTESYARALMQLGPPAHPADYAEVLVQTKIDRQTALTDREPPLELWAIVDEAALHRQVGGPDVMNEQLEKLLEVTSLPNITLQIIPFDKGVHPGMLGAFVHLEFDDPADPALVYLESNASEVFLESDSDVRQYAAIFDHLRAIALAPNESRAFVSALSDGSAR